LTWTHTLWAIKINKAGGEMRKFIFILLITFLFVILYSDENIYVKGETLNVRETPDGEKIGVINFGTKMETIEKEGKWVKVKIEGWVWEPLTVSEKPKKENLKQKVIKSKNYRIVMWSSSLFSGAGSNNSKIGSIQKGEKLEVIEEKKLTFRGITVPWYYVMKSNGKKGWVSDADLELP
jgi:uncharacterized protein YgiM (DUF1202 family)